MKLLINCIKIIGIYTFNTIGLIYPQRNVYISSQLQLELIHYIENTIDKMNLTRTFDKTENHIRIQYKNDIIANTAMSSELYSTGYFVIENTVISFNPNLYENILGCVILHELAHSMSLFHNNIIGSIMNYTLFVDKNGYILNDTIECFLNTDDINGLQFTSNIQNYK